MVGLIPCLLVCLTYKISMETKICPKCKSNLSLDMFQKNKRSKDGLQYHCRSCRKELDARPEKRKADRQRYHSNRESYLNGYYKRVYGITLSEYKVIFDNQKGVCAICNKECSSGKQLAVDHDHETGQIRGLLCTKCNQGLGMFNDSVDLLNRSISYLESKRK